MSNQDAASPSTPARYTRLLIVPPFAPSAKTDRFPADFALYCPTGDLAESFPEELDALCRRYQEVLVHAPLLAHCPQPLPGNCFPLDGLALTPTPTAAPLRLAVQEKAALWHWLHEAGHTDAADQPLQIAPTPEHAAQAVFLLPGPTALNAGRPKYFCLTGDPDLEREPAAPVPTGTKRLVASLGTYRGNWTHQPDRELDEWAQIVRDAAAETGWAVTFVTAPESPAYPEARQDDAALTGLAAALADAAVLVTACPRAVHVAVALGRQVLFLPMEPYVSALFRDAAAPCVLPVAHDGKGLAALLAECEAGTAFPADRDLYAGSHNGRRAPRENLPALLRSLREAASVTLENLPDLRPVQTVASQTPLSVFVFGANPQGAYSGGRYFAWILAESLALVGHDVTFVTNVEPIFSRDFELSPAHHRLKVILSPTYNIRRLACSPDCIIIVPSMFGSHYFYENAISFAKQHKAHTCLLNFETPNWYNALSPIPRDPLAWADWARTVQHCSLVISMLHITSRYARDYYDLFHEGCQHIVASPPINDMAADIVPLAARENRLVAIIRFDLAEHKGVTRLLELIDEPMRGYTLALLVGQDKRPEAFVQQMEERAAAHGVQLEFLDRLSDVEKFEQLSRAKLLLFMSQFEGYGYPPLEALYCGTPCLAFDLEPLRETCGDLLHYAPLGDWGAFKTLLAEVLAAPGADAPETPFDPDPIRMPTFGAQLGQALLELCAAPVDNAVWTHGLPPYKAFCDAYSHRLLAGDTPLPLPAAWLTVLDASLHDGCVLSVAAIVTQKNVTVSLAVGGEEIATQKPGALAPDIQGQALLVRRILPPAALAEPPRTCTLTLCNDTGVRFATELQLRPGEERSPAALFIENQQFDARQDMLRLKGWAIGGAPGYCLKISQQEREIGYALPNLPRPDLAGRYTLEERQCGWTFEGRLETTDRTVTSVTVEMLRGERILARRRLRVPLPEKPVLEWEGLDAPAQDGPVVAVITHVPFLPVSQGNHIVIAQLLRWLRTQGYRVFLVLQIHPRFLLEHQAAYQAVADRIFVVNPELKVPGTVPLNKSDLTHINTKRCLHDIASRYDLRAAIAEYVHLAAALEGRPAGVLGIVQTHDVLHRMQAFKAKGIPIEPPFRDCNAADEKKLLRCAEVVVAIQDHERGIFAKLAPERHVITVGVVGDYFGAPLPPSPETSRSVFIAASGNPLNVAGLKQFLQHCWPAILAQVPEARLCLAGKVGQAGAFTAPQVECLGILDNLDEAYRQAAVCINPVTLGTGLKIKSVETLARGRALVSTGVGLEGIHAYGHEAFVLADGWDLFTAAVVELLRNVPRRHAIERQAADYARLYLDQDFVYRQLAEAFARHAAATRKETRRPPLLRVI